MPAVKLKFPLYFNVNKQFLLFTEIIFNYFKWSGFFFILLFIRMSCYFKSGTTTIQEGSITRGTPTNKVSVETIPSLRGSITQVFYLLLGRL